MLPAGEQRDDNNYAIDCFLARYRGATLRSYKQAMLAFLRWCTERQLAPLQAKRSETRSSAPAS